MSQVNRERTSEDSRLAAVLADLQARIAAGEFIERERFIAQHPDLADQLRSYFLSVEHGSTRIRDSTPQDSAETRFQNQEVSDTSRGPSAVRGTKAAEIPQSFGRYKVIRALGQGAMGAVYLAHDTQLDRQVALKIPKFSETDGTEMLERFYREARSAATIRHPNICPVYDVGDINGQHYISMAFIEGRPLKDFVRSAKRHSSKQIAVTVRKLALALAEAHAHGVVHRDLKPANIMVDNKGEPVVMDFGLARRLSGEEGHATQSGVIVGTPAYMSPEQAQGDPRMIGPQADVYGLGVIMYELLTGQVPFQGSLMSILKQIALDEPQPPSALRDEVDPQLESICLKMMAKDTASRFQSSTEVAQALGDWIRSSASGKSSAQAKRDSRISTDGAVDDRRQAVASATSMMSVAPRRQSQQRARRRRALVGGIAAVVVIGAVLASLPWLRPEAPGSSAGDTPKVETPKVETPKPDGASAIAAKPDVPPETPKPVDSSVAGAAAAQPAAEPPSSEVVEPDVQDFAVRFPTIDSRAELPPLALDPDGPLTVECRVRGFTGTKQEQIFLIMIGSLHLKLMHPNNNPAWTTFGGKPEGQGLSFRLVAPWPETPAPPVDTHLAFVRADSYLRLYVNGKLGDQKRDDHYQFSADRWSIGQGGNWDGWIDEVRVSKIARYKEEFTPEPRLTADEDTLALYHFDEGRTTVLADSSRHGAHGRLVRATWVRTDGSPARRRVPREETRPVHPAEVVVSDRGLQFDGVDDYVWIPTLSLKRDEPVTMEGFVRCERDDRFMQIVALHGSEAVFGTITYGLNLDAGMQSNEPGAVRFQPGGNRKGERFHFAATWDGRITRLFQNGQECLSEYPRDPEIPKAPAQGCIIGNTAIKSGESFIPSNFGYLEGTLDGIRISRGLRYEKSFSPPAALEDDEDTVALYRFDEGQGEVLRDASGNGHDGRVYGDARWIVKPE